MKLPPQRTRVQQVFEGDTVRIRSQGVVRTGEVLSTFFDRYDHTYCLEIESVEAGYCYFKEGMDGGTIEFLEKGPNHDRLAEQEKAYAEPPQIDLG